MRMPRMYRDLAWTWALISPVEDYEREAAQFVAAIRRYALGDVHTILDLGCGGGHNDFHLKQWLRVTGVDLSDEMLSYARTLNPEVEYLKGDMRNVRMGRKFDAVLIADAGSYLLTRADLRMAFKTAYTHLRPGGVLCTYQEEAQERFRQHEVHVTQHSRGEVHIALVEYSYDPDLRDTEFDSVFVYLIKKDGSVEVVTDRHTLGLFTSGTWSDLLEEVGFAVREVSFEGEDFPLLIGMKPTLSGFTSMEG
ncbi:MAG: class I SAM-dependent methyltransferase [Candidatus Thermoplasmatota archaeon]